nr:unnamed protein product [Callosobruchus analis]
MHSSARKLFSLLNLTKMDDFRTTMSALACKKVISEDIDYFDIRFISGHRRGAFIRDSNNFPKMWSYNLNCDNMKDYLTDISTSLKDFAV